MYFFLMHTKALTIVAFIIALSAAMVLPMTAEESDATDIYRTFFIDELNGTFESIENDYYKHLEPFSEKGNRTSDILHPTHDGYTFKGWFDKQGRQFNENAPIESSVRYYAQWEEAAPQHSPLGVAAIAALTVMALIGCILLFRYAVRRA